MIAGFFNRNTDFDILTMEPRHCEEAAEIHAARFSRPWSAEEIDTLLSQTNVHGFVARPSAGGRAGIAGFVVARFAASEAEILTIGMRERAQGRGLGWRLMAAAIRQMRDDGAEALFLEVDETNARAVALYRKLGFVTVAERRAYYRQPDGARTSALVMRLDLI